jgi:hypothetical protein
MGEERDSCDKKKKKHETFFVILRIIYIRRWFEWTYKRLKKSMKGKSLELQ